MTSIHIDQLIRSNRKTIALVITRDGQLVVRAPLRASKQLIEGFVQQKAAWINEKQRQARQSVHHAVPHSFTAGESFLYLGHAYPLVITPRARPALTLERVAGLAQSANGHDQPTGQVQPLPVLALPVIGQPVPCFLLAAHAQPDALKVFTQWYRLQAQAVLRERIAFYSAITGLTATRLRITSARTRWGSCSSGGVLSFPWRLVMAPMAAIDYVVVHELVHITEKNHARPFWQGVARILPDYAHQMAWLKANGHLLTLE